MSHNLNTAEVYYPSSDGKPMAETDLHWDWMVTNAQRLKRFHAGRRVYVGCNLLIYYQKDDPRKSVAPDAFVVKNCRPGRREIFQIWKERRTPNFVLETTSKTTRRTDGGKKKKLYAKLGIGEYFLYDPRGDWLKPPLQGYRLRSGAYEPIVADAQGRLLSEELGIYFALEHGDLVMIDAATGERLLSSAEAEQQETQRADEEKRRADDAERALAKLREAYKKRNGSQRKNGD